MLVLADLVKFAKEQPLPLENEQSFTQSVEFVRETRPKKDALAAPDGNNSNSEQKRPE